MATRIQDTHTHRYYIKYVCVHMWVGSVLILKGITSFVIPTLELHVMPPIWTINSAILIWLEWYTCKKLAYWVLIIHASSSCDINNFTTIQLKECETRVGCPRLQSLSPVHTDRDNKSSWVNREPVRKKFYEESNNIKIFLELKFMKITTVISNCQMTLPLHQNY